MCSSFRVKDGFADFETWNKIWHENFKRRNPNYRNTMYMDGQFDEIPYAMWSENDLIDEFDFHEELIKYDKENV